MEDTMAFALKRFGLIAALAASFTSLSVSTLLSSPGAKDIVGVWLDPKGDGGIELKPCANGAGICGHIVWLKDPVDKTGRPVRDENNRDPSKRSALLCNLQLIGGGTRKPDGSLEKGWIYNPEDGGRYDVDIVRIDQNRIKVHGYLGAKFLGETFVWRKAPDNLGRCTTTAQRA
jgi:uncharacterized protein (DUF2147 family)